MAKFVPDIKTQRWIILSPVRLQRPDDNVTVAKSKICPFCTGNEKETPPEIMRIPAAAEAMAGKGKGDKDTPGWKIRVVPNKFPITDYHEVIIHSPDHEKNIDEFEDSHVLSILEVYRTRFQAHLNDGYVMVFSNYGEHAGASLKHPHSQVVVIPRQINLDSLSREPVRNVIEDNNFFVTYCPDFSQWPYEVWIAPKKSAGKFSGVSDEELKDLAPILKKTVKRLKIKYNQPESKKIHPFVPFAYNYYIHHEEKWFIRIIPRLIHRAGFELGTGLSVNIVDPSEAAKELAEIKI